MIILLWLLIVSSWGEVFSLAQAQQSHAPAFWPHTDGGVASWVAADRDDAFHYLHLPDREPLQLPIPPVFPHQQRLFPAGNQGWHLTWLDAPWDDPGAGVHLWTVMIAPDGTLERSPINLSDKSIFHHDIIVNGDRSLTAVWSSGLAAEPGLYHRHIDSLGRPRVPDRLAASGDWPALVQFDGETYLYWLMGGSIYSARLHSGSLDTSEPVTRSIRLAPGDRLAGFSAGADNRTRYLFWNLVRADGTAETWWTSGPAWPQPQRLGLTVSSDTTFVTTFNGGAAQAAGPGVDWAAWAAPLRGQTSVLPVAVQVSDSLGVIYFEAGQIAGYQAVIDLDHTLIGLPALHTDRDRHLYLAWSEPTGAGIADLKYTGTR